MAGSRQFPMRERRRLKGGTPLMQASQTIGIDLRRSRFWCGRIGDIKPPYSDAGRPRHSPKQPRSTASLDMPWATLVGQISKAYGKESAARVGPIFAVLPSGYGDCT
jgi:hypothetical protein